MLSPAERHCRNARLRAGFFDPLAGRIMSSANWKDSGGLTIARTGMKKAFVFSWTVCC